MSKYSDITDTQRWYPEPSGRETKSDGAYLMQRSLVDTNSCRDTEHRVRNICIRTLSGPNIGMCDRTRRLPGIMLISSCRLRGGQTVETKVRESIPSTHSDVASWKSWVSRLSECNVKMVDASLSGRKRLNPRGTRSNSWCITDISLIIYVIILHPPIKHGLLSVFLIWNLTLEPPLDQYTLLNDEYLKTFGVSARDNKHATVLKSLHEKLARYQH